MKPLCELIFLSFAASFVNPSLLLKQPALLFSWHFQKETCIMLKEMLRPPSAKQEHQISIFFPHLILYLCILLFCQFFVEEPGGTREDAFTTGPPEVLLLTSDTNVTNETSPDTLEGSSRGDKFYLPVGLTIVVSLCCFRSTTVKLLH